MACAGLFRTIFSSALALAAPAPAQPAASLSPPPPAACPARTGWATLAFADARAHFPGPYGNRPVNWIGAGADGALLWNGRPVAGESVRNYLVIVAAIQPRPVTVIQRLPGASCAAVAAAVALAEAAFRCAPEKCVITAGEAFAPPPLSAPSPPLRLVEHARIRARVADYVSGDDYPSAALRNREQGVVGFRLAVGPQGRVTRCTVTNSSGSALLDAATCRIMTSRARFTPARNSLGEPASDIFSSRVIWRLPPLPPEPEPPESQPLKADPSPGHTQIAVPLLDRRG